VLLPANFINATRRNKDASGAEFLPRGNFHNNVFASLAMHTTLVLRGVLSTAVGITSRKHHKGRYVTFSGFKQLQIYLPSKQLTKSMEQSPSWEANRP
jgi:hypothetical protein